MTTKFKIHRDPNLPSRVGLARVEAKTKLDAEFIAAVKPSIVRVWEIIAGDSYAVAQECGERMTNEAALEGAIDANRITTFCKRPDVDALIGAAIEEHGYSKVMTALKSGIKLA